MNEELKKKIEEICSDEEYVKYLLSLKNAEAIAKELESKDIIVTPEELRSIGTLLRKKQNGELSEEELEKISGGIFWEIVLGIVVAGTVAFIGWVCIADHDDC